MLIKEERKHYRVADGPCHDVLMAWKRRRDEVSETQWEFTRSVGAVGFYPGPDDNVGNALSINGFIFPETLPTGWKSRRWKSFSGDLRGRVVGWPDQRTKIGREILSGIKALPLTPSTVEPCKAIGFPASLKYHGPDWSGSTALGFFSTLNVGWIANTFYVSLPDEAKERQRLIMQGYVVEGEPWTPLPGMNKILKEEADLDFARAKLEEAA